METSKAGFKVGPVEGVDEVKAEGVSVGPTVGADVVISDLSFEGNCEGDSVGFREEGDKLGNSDGSDAGSPVGNKIEGTTVGLLENFTVGA